MSQTPTNLGWQSGRTYLRSADEQRALFEKVQAALDQAGGKNVVLCDASWATQHWPFFGVNQFPDIEGVQKHTIALRAINWFGYVEVVTTLGTETPM